MPALAQGQSVVRAKTSVSLSISGKICMRRLGALVATAEATRSLLSGVNATICFWHYSCHGKAAPSAGHDTSVCNQMNSSCSVGVVPVASGNWISKTPSPGTFCTFIFRQFWECKIVKMPHTAAGTALCSEFSFLQISYDSVLSFRTFPCETFGIPAAAWRQLSVRDLR